jgi:hypothetical protein
MGVAHVFFDIGKVLLLVQMADLVIRFRVIDRNQSARVISRTSSNIKTMG